MKQTTRTVDHESKVAVAGLRSHSPLTTHYSRRAPLTTHHLLLTNRGQALLELAFFGSLTLLVLGAMVSFGLNADFNQQATMGSFRQALASAAEFVQNQGQGQPTSVTHIQVDDLEIANPSHPFALGPVVPMTASGNVTRSWKLQEAGDAPEELPRIRVAIQGGDVDCPSAGVGCTTAGFRIETSIPPDNPGTKKEDPHVIDRYFEIYGRSSVCAKTACGGACLETDSKTKQCLKAKTLKIIDRCEGEIINQSACVQQARQIVDSQVCTALCEKGKPPGGSPLDCEGICSQPMNVPWYAQGAVLIDEENRRYDFPKLDELFDGVRGLGLQTGYARASQSTMGTTLEWKKKKGEDDDKPKILATTSDLVGSQDTFTRNVFFNDILDGNGVSKGVANRQQLTRDDQVCITSCAQGASCPNGVEVTSPGEPGCPSPVAKTWINQ